MRELARQRLPCSTAPSDGGKAAKQLRKSQRKGTSSSPRGSADESRSADRQLDDEIRKHRQLLNYVFNKAAQQHDKVRATHANGMLFA